MKVFLNIQSLLDKKNRNLRWLESETGISYQALWNMRKGKTVKIEFETIGRLLGAFKCSPNQLFKIEQNEAGNKQQ